MTLPCVEDHAQRVGADPVRSVRIGVLPGVWPPHRDAWLLAELARELAPGRDVLDVFTGSGVLAVSAAAAGARSVTAVDVSRRALLAVRLNAWRNGCRARVRALRGDLFAPVRGERFDLIVANPPYVAGEDALPARGIARAWEGGVDGRALIDPLLAAAPAHLRPGGQLAVLHSSLNGEQTTSEALERAGLRVEVAVRHPGPVGPITRERTGSVVEETLVFLATH